MNILKAKRDFVWGPKVSPVEDVTRLNCWVKEKLKDISHFLINNLF